MARRLVGTGAAAMVAAGLSGCGWFSSEPEAPPPEPLAATAPVEARPVSRVGVVEIGRAPRGYVVSAHGESDEDGWSGPRLLERGIDAEGFLVFEFVATPPAEPGPVRRQRLRADALVAAAEMDAAAGVRVVAREGRVAAAPPR